MKSFGEEIKELRINTKVPLRIVAHFLDVDQAILSKIENGKRNASKEQVKKLALFFKVDEKKLLISYLADKVVYQLEDEDFKHEILAVAEERVAYRNSLSLHQQRLINELKNFFLAETRILAAYLFGSAARNESKPSSDVDIMIEFFGNQKHTLFDLLDIQDQLQKLLHRKVDLVEKGFVKPFAKNTIEKDLKLIVQK